MMLPRKFGRFRPDGNFWTVPNVLSMGRVLLAVPVAWLILVDGSLGWIFALLAVMITSDWLDGRIARWSGRVSDWGKLLDPLADKIAGIVIVLALAFRGMLPGLVPDGADHARSAYSAGVGNARPSPRTHGDERLVRQGGRRGCGRYRPCRADAGRRSCDAILLVCDEQGSWQVLLQCMGPGTPD